MVAIALAISGGLNMPSSAVGAPPKYSPNVPAKITTPDTVETRIGALRFKDGAPDPATVQLAYDQIDFNRGIDAFVKGMSATSVYAACRGLEEAGVKPNGGIGITEQLVDARSLFLTPNTTTVYVMMCVNLKDGPVVVRVPPRVLGPVDDADFRWVTDVGLTGPDKGAGGDYLFVPPGHKGTLPEKGFNVSKPRTNRLLVFYRVFVEKGDLAAATAGVKAKAAVFPLSQAAKPPASNFVNLSGVKFNTISANDYSFYEELNAVVQNEPADWVDPDTVGLYAAIGIRKGQPFAPDARLKKTLTEAVAMGNAYARSNLFASRDPSTRIFKDRQWLTPFVGGSYQFLTDQKSAGLDSNVPALKKNADGGATIWFGPEVPAGNEANWVQTMPGKGYNLLLRLYGPLEPWFNQTWQPGDLELQK